MKHIFYFMIGAIMLSSCSSTHFFATVSSVDKQNTVQVENGDFLQENDSLWIAYSFNGEGAPIQVTVFNKSDVPIYVDWEKSSFVINQVAYNFLDEKLNFEFVNEGTIDYNKYPSVLLPDAVYSGMTRGSMSLPKNVSQIPPNSMVSKKSYHLTNTSFDKVGKDLYRKTIIQSKTDERFTAQRAEFQLNDTPLNFKSYITVYTNPNNPKHYESNFFVATLIKSRGLSPSKLPTPLAERGDMFFVRKPANNNFWFALLGVGAVVGYVALDAGVK